MSEDVEAEAEAEAAEHPAPPDVPDENPPGPDPEIVSTEERGGWPPDTKDS